MIKVFHLAAGTLSGGAARGAYWLHRALIETGIDSTLAHTGRATSQNQSVLSIESSTLKRIKLDTLNRFPFYFYKNKKPWLMSTGFAGLDFRKLSKYQESDLVHLHWINDFVAIRELQKIKKPIVWTIRDMWPFTGGCHYSIDCERYTLGCGHCPQLQSHRNFDLTRLVVLNKLHSIPKRTRIVGISNWISEEASRSLIFKDHKINRIGNAIDMQEFSPIDLHEARKALNLPTNKRVILIGAQNVSDHYKGFALLLDALRCINSKFTHILTFGRGAEKAMASIPISQTHLGFLSDSFVLRCAYASADIFVAPSQQEAFGKTLAEAQACGTPVVCFDATGPKDIVEHKLTGYKAKPFDASDLARGIDWVLAQPKDKYDLLRQRARERIINFFDSKIIARQYIALYKDVLNGC